MEPSLFRLKIHSVYCLITTNRPLLLIARPIVNLIRKFDKLSTVGIRVNDHLLVMWSPDFTQVMKCFIPCQCRKLEKHCVPWSHLPYRKLSAVHFHRALTLVLESQMVDCWSNNFIDELSGLACTWLPFDCNPQPLAMNVSYETPYCHSVRPGSYWLVGRRNYIIYYFPSVLLVKKIPYHLQQLFLDWCQSYIRALSVLLRN